MFGWVVGLALFVAVLPAAVVAGGDADQPWQWLLSNPHVTAYGVKARAGAAAASSASGLGDVYATRSSGRPGLFATEALVAGDTAVGVPSEFLFHPTRVSDPLLHSFLNYTKDNSFLLDQRVVLTVGLLHQYLRHVLKQAILGDTSKLSGASAAVAKQHSSRWDLYLSSLPKRPASIMLFDAFELEQLQLPEASPLFSARDQQLEYIAEMYKFVASVIAANKPLQALFPKETFTEQWFTWAYVTVLNRGVELPLLPWSANDSSLVVLAPFIDLANHANPPNCNAVLEMVRGSGSGADALPSHLRIVATRAIAAGEEITIPYSNLFPLTDPATPTAEAATPTTTADGAASGSSAAAAADATRSVVRLPVHGYSNTQLLVHFGVALPINEYEHIALDIGFDESHRAEDELYEHKDRILNLNSLSRNCLVSVDGTLPASFLHALRVKQLTRDDLARLSHFGYQFLPENGFFSLQNELRVQLALLTSVEDLLRAYPTTLSKDTTIAGALQQFLARAGDGKAHPNMAQVLAYRLSVKRVLHVLILRSLSSLHELFGNLTARWKTDLTEAMNALPKPAADATGKVEVNIDATGGSGGASASDMHAKWDDPIDGGDSDEGDGGLRGDGDGKAKSGDGSGGDGIAKSWRSWSQWQRKLADWNVAISVWHAEYSAWVRTALGTDALPLPRPNKPVVPNDLFTSAAKAAAASKAARTAATAAPTAAAGGRSEREL